MEKIDKRSRVAVTRLTEREFHRLLELASRQDMSFSDLLRAAALEYLEKNKD